MAVNFKIYQSNRNGNTKGQFYARAAHRDTVTIKDLAEVMQNNSTVKYSDILAVLTELSEVMRQELQRSNRVKIDGIGTFKVAVRSKGAASAKEFTVAENIKGVHVLFLPEVTVDASGKHVKTLLAGVKVRESDSYDSLKAKEKAEEKAAEDTVDAGETDNAQDEPANAGE